MFAVPPREIFYPGGVNHFQCTFIVCCCVFFSRMYVHRFSVYLILITTQLAIKCRCFYFSVLVSMRVSLLLVFASYWNDLAFNVCLKCRNEYKVYNIVSNLMVRCEYVVVFSFLGRFDMIFSFLLLFSKMCSPSYMKFVEK